MKLIGSPDNKNLIIRRLTELTGQKASYTGAPDFAYDIGNYRVLRDGSVIVLDELADGKVLDALIRDKLAADPYAAASDNSTGSPTWRVPTDLSAPSSVSRPEAIDAHYGSVAADSTAPAYPCRHDTPIRIQRPAIEIRTMINLINMLASKGDLLSKAVGKPGAFWVSDNILFDLNYAKPTTFCSLQRVLRVSDRASLLKGLAFEVNAVTFTGFPATNDFVIRSAYERLAGGMFAYCEAMKYTSSRQFPTSNEKSLSRVRYQTYFHAANLTVSITASSAGSS